MHEQAFVLGREWLDLLTRKSESATEVKVGKLRGWIGDQQPGLPDEVQRLIVACYAIQADKAWLRGERLIDAPQLDKIADDMALRSQELPTPEEFELASSRAAGIFRVTREPVRTARSVHALAVKVRQNAQGRLAPMRDLAAELTGHAATLGLADESPAWSRRGSSRACSARPRPPTTRRHSGCSRRPSCPGITPSTRRTWRTPRS